MSILRSVGGYYSKVIKIGPAVPEIFGCTHTHTHTQTDILTPWAPVGAKNFPSKAYNDML